MSGPRMGMSQMNGSSRRPPNLNRAPSTENRQPFCSQHDDLIKYIFDSWNKVYQEVDRNSGASVLFYQEQENHNLKNFEPFDLEGLRGGNKSTQNYQPQQHS